ncbi:MAG: hypothetical protein U1E49_09505 [Hyphomicrobiaceae bacterium]
MTDELEEWRKRSAARALSELPPTPARIRIRATVRSWLVSHSKLALRITMSWTARALRWLLRQPIAPFVLALSFAFGAWLLVSTAFDITAWSHGYSIRWLGPGCEFKCGPDTANPLFVWLHIAWLALIAAILAPLPLAVFKAWRSGAVVSFVAWSIVMGIVPVQYYLEYDNGKGMEPVLVQVPDDIAQFRHPWCGSWAFDKVYCKLKPDGEAECTGKRLGINNENYQPRLRCGDWDAPNWCIVWRDPATVLHRRWPFDLLGSFVETYFPSQYAGVSNVSDDARVSVPPEEPRIYCSRTIFGERR